MEPIKFLYKLKVDFTKDSQIIYSINKHKLINLAWSKKTATIVKEGRVLHIFGKLLLHFRLNL